MVTETGETLVSSTELGSKLGDFINHRHLTEAAITPDSILKQIENRAREIQLPPINPYQGAIIIPAYREPKIDQTLGRVLKQLESIPEESPLGLEKIEIIIVINGQDQEITKKAIARFQEKSRLSQRVSLRVEQIPEAGKLIAIRHGLNILRQQEKFPRFTFLLDADTQLKPGTLAAVHNLLLGPKVQAAGPKIVQEDPKEPHEFPMRIVLRGHGKPGTNWLQGACIAFKAEATTLYLAMTETLPGLLTDDVGFSLLLHLMGKNYQLTSDERLIMPPPNNWSQALNQILRWLQGLKQLELILPPNKAIASNSVIAKIKRVVENHFPGGLKRGPTAEEIRRFIRLAPRELLTLPLFEAIFTLINQGISLKLANLTLEGKVPNPFRPQSWTPPRSEN